MLQQPFADIKIGLAYLSLGASTSPCWAAANTASCAIPPRKKLMMGAGHVVLSKSGTERRGTVLPRRTSAKVYQARHRRYWDRGSPHRKNCPRRRPISPICQLDHPEGTLPRLELFSGSSFSSAFISSRPLSIWPRLTLTDGAYAIRALATADGPRSTKASRSAVDLLQFSHIQIGHGARSIRTWVSLGRSDQTGGIVQQGRDPY